MSLLKEQIDILERDLLSKELKISPYHDLPFAIFRYEPEFEFEMRKEATLLATRLKNKGKKVHIISLAELFFEAIEKEGGKELIIKEEKEYGFLKAQESLNTIFSDPDYSPIPDMLVDRLEDMDAKEEIVFLTRAGIFSPKSYRISKLLDEIHGKTRVPTILFYPGTVEGVTGLKFMGIPMDDRVGSYHVNIYNR
ncbi:MAG: hypothetical protein SCARUB_02075 [Candidatus Scalindua rubra]|uniref:DUF1788 domain-containing protein n=1 Tax=Candidatus Scalindua rubra TaxID=1872076 RepID=A0A1E3XB39_9BACT|nr:MAG: hypothetical protein SCARUB_02075 [Candidatus Scalindua rubra]